MVLKCVTSRLQGSATANITIVTPAITRGHATESIHYSVSKREDSISTRTPAVSLPNYQKLTPAEHSHLHSFSYRFLKPTLDVFLVVLTAPLWLPLCITVGFLIWLEDGNSPLFFQKRIGKNNRPFTIWKFRTMKPDATEALQKVLVERAIIREAWASHYKLQDDPRITRIGKFLRRFSIDELPQLFNVLLGQMSLIGPRPLPLYHHESLSAATRFTRQCVKPGLSGLWQVSGRSDCGNRGMELWDPFYVRNWSLWLDMNILRRTFSVVSRGTGAY